MSNEWISVEDALPDEDVWVLCAKKIGVMVMCGTFSFNGQGFYMYGYPHIEKDITHWMPLPERPNKF